MNRYDIIRMAREACASFETAESMFRFAALVAAAEREACAAICKDEAKRLADSADRLEARGSNYEASQIRGLAWKCILLKDRIEDRGKP